MEIRLHAFAPAFLWGVDLASKEDPLLEQKLKFALEMDKLISKYNLLVSDTLFGVYPKPISEIKHLEVSPYSLSEVKKLFAENLFSKRKVRAILLSFKLGSWLYGLLRIAKKYWIKVCNAI